MIKFKKLSAIVFALAIGVSGQSETLAKEYFGHIKNPSSGKSEAIGQYSLGCLSGGEQLAETGPSWQAMRLSRNRNYGHPELVDLIERLSKTAVSSGWAGLYVGDMSQPRGGPMLSGHASHQVGLDADIWMLPAKRINLTRGERENLSSISVVSNDFSKVNGTFTQAHYNIMRAAASDPTVARIFVTPAVKVAMCNVTKNDRSWLRTIRPWWGHNYHFHVRMKCPAGSGSCVNQAPPPPGDGCDEARAFLRGMLNPPKADPNAPKPAPKPRKVLSNMPNQCAALVQ